MRGTKILVCVLLILSVATILITPDQSDDIPGVLHHVSKIKLLAVWAFIQGPLTVISAQSNRPALSPRNPDPPELLTLFCVRLC